MSFVLDGMTMDGRVHSYMPDEQLVVNGDVPLHDAVAANLDPIEYEVIRYSLWNINEEHGLTIQKVSGSGIAKYARDFNPCIMTEDAEYVYFGPYVTMHAGVQDLNVRWILEYLADNPGIHEGDLFLCNDPWIGATHQSDTSVLCPVFHDGALFCWVANTLHFADLGGVRPGGWSPSAEDVFAEPTPTPPIKIVEGGVLRRDLENLWKRQSRVPELTALDLRALVAGNTFARSRIELLIARYGPKTVKAAMRKVIDDSERVFVERLRRIPDGRWRDRIYMEAAGPGDRGVYRGVLTLTKDGESLVFSNEGSDPAAGVLNSAYSGWRAAILAIVASLLCHDTLRAVGGPLRHIRFRPAPGTLATADFPSAVSSGVVFASANALSLATSCINKMLAFGPEGADTIVCSSGIGHFPIDSLSGVDQHGEYFSNAILDFNASPTGAGALQDGIPTATPFWAMETIAPNVEENEQVMPILYLWRRERRDSGGVGEFTGGASLDVAFVAHGTDVVVHQIASCGVAVPSSTGLFGGHPGAPNRYRLLGAGDLARLWREQRMPRELGELDGQPELLKPKMSDVLQRASDVIEIGGAAGGGLGDPLDRAPDRVVHDVELGYYGRTAAERFFGVVFAPGEPVSIDASATSELRERLRAARLGRADSPRQVEAAEACTEWAGANERRVLPNLVLQERDGARRLACATCATGLGDGVESYKSYTAVVTDTLAAAGPLVEDPGNWVDDDMVLWAFVCPGCAGLLELEIARRDDDWMHDVELARADG